MTSNNFVRRIDVLAVDDEPDNLTLLIETLDPKIYSVRPATSGAMAIQAARLEPPDVVLLDVKMPAMDGYEVCRQLKQDPKLKDVVVIFISGLEDTVDKVKGFEVGGIDFLNKPLKVAELDARIQRHIQVQRLRSELEARLWELQRAHKKLHRLESDRNKMTQMLASDFRNPLGLVALSLEMLKMQSGGSLNEASRGVLGEAGRQIALMGNMIEELIDIRRLEEGALEVDLGTHDLREIVELSRASLPEEKDRISVEGLEEPCLVCCDSGLIRRVTTNLLTNAVNFAPKDSEIQVRIEADAELVLLEVRDHGPGIAKKDQDKVFGEFWQGKTHTGDAAPSPGLGLNFCKLAVDAHGGTIGLESKPSDGCVFRVTLAAAEADTEVESSLKVAA